MMYSIIRGMNLKRRKIFIYFYFRERVREGERVEEKHDVREKHRWLPLTHGQTGNQTCSRACALTGNLTGNPSLCGMAPNQLCHTSHGWRRKIFDPGNRECSHGSAKGSSELASVPLAQRALVLLSSSEYHLHLSVTCLWILSSKSTPLYSTL